MPSLDRVEGDATPGRRPRARARSRAPTRAPHVCSWSAAAARNVSAAPSTTRAPVGDEHPGQLAAGRGLAGAVDADDQHDRRAVLSRARCVTACGRWSVPTCASSSSRSSARSVARGCGCRAPAPASAAPRRAPCVGRDADVGGEQRVLDLLPGRRRRGGRATSSGEQAPAERVLRAGQPGAQPHQPAGGRARSLQRRRASRRRCAPARGRLDGAAAPSGGSTVGDCGASRSAGAPRRVRPPPARYVQLRRGAGAAAAACRPGRRRPRPTTASSTDGDGDEQDHDELHRRRHLSPGTEPAGGGRGRGGRRGPRRPGSLRPGRARGAAG